MQRTGNCLFLRVSVICMILMLNLLSCTLPPLSLEQTSSLPGPSQKPAQASLQPTSTSASPQVEHSGTGQKTNQLTIPGNVIEQVGKSATASANILPPKTGSSSPPTPPQSTVRPRKPGPEPSETPTTRAGCQDIPDLCSACPVGTICTGKPEVPTPTPRPLVPPEVACPPAGICPPPTCPGGICPNPSPCPPGAICLPPPSPKPRRIG